LLAVFAIPCLCLVSARSQLPKRLERCLPNPTLAQEIRDMKPPEPQVYVHVVQVEFAPDIKIPRAIQDEIVKSEAGKMHEEDADSDYLKDVAAEVAEVSVRGSLQSAGYFRVLADAKATVLKTKGQDIDVVVTVSAEPGNQYRTGEIEFKDADPDRALAYSPETLRTLIPLRPGDLLDVDAIRKGLRDLTNLYGTEGYIDMTAEPEFKIDEATKIIDMTIRVDEQKQYRIREIEFWGARPQLERQLKESFQKSGEVFDKSRMEQFIKENLTLLPPDAAADQLLSIRRDAFTGMVDIVFDLQTCPGTGL